MIDIIRDLFHQPFFVSLLAMITCACFYYLKSKRKAQRDLVWVVYSLIFVASFLVFIGNAIYSIYHPGIWDFACFYLYGKVAAGGYNFYLPENFHHVFNSLNLPFSSDEGFTLEVLNVGFPYPPPTIFYYLPLAFFSFKTALMLWTIFNLILVFGCVYLIYTLFLKAYKLNGILLIAVLSFILLPSISTIKTAQTNFLLLFFVLLMYKYSNSKYSGIFLTLAFLTKPYAIVFILFLFAIKNWKAIIYSALSLIALNGLVILMFGVLTIKSYIFDSPFKRLPKATFTEDTKQSLEAVLLRSKTISFSNQLSYIYMSIGIVLLFLAYLFFLGRKKLLGYFWVFPLLIGITLYPNTQSTYGVILLFIIFQFFVESGPLSINLYLNILIIGVFYYLTTFSLFYSFCFLLVVTVFKSLNLLQQNKFTSGEVS